MNLELKAGTLQNRVWRSGRLRKWLFGGGPWLPVSPGPEGLDATWSLPLPATAAIFFASYFYQSEWWKTEIVQQFEQDGSQGANMRDPSMRHCDRAGLRTSCALAGCSVGGTPHGFDVTGHLITTSKPQKRLVSVTGNMVRVLPHRTG
jgi:hypothetical protein